MERYGRSFRDGNCNSLIGEFSWPQRSYTCSFCKREFKSAQALGGHMNVHRRDRARLRQSPPRDPPPCNPNPSPNPNPLPNLNFSPPSCTSTEAKLDSPVTYTFPSLLSPRTPVPFRSRCDDLKSTRAVKALFGVKKMEGFMEEEKVVMTTNKREVEGIDLEEGLDLELRLGFA